MTIRTQLSCAFLLAGALALPSVAAAQSEPRAASSSSETRGSAEAPAGMHYVRRMNVPLTIAGPMIFFAAYVPFAIDGIVQAGATTYNHNWERAAPLHAVPFLGFFLANADFNSRQTTACNAMMSAGNVVTTTPYSPCIDENSGMLDSNGRPRAPSYVPRLTSAGDWLWATTQLAMQALGVGIFVWGIVGEMVLESNGSAAATDRQALRRRPTRWALTPGANGAPVGLTFTSLHF